MASLEAHYSARDIEARILGAIRAAGLDPAQRLSPDELGALDHFHTGGLRASLELLELARIQAGDRVLDIGAGLAGAARLLASALGCRVDCVELSPDYCAGAVLLNRLTGLDDRIEVHEGSALDLPFPDDSFDAAWMQNVGMNIEDKRKLYAEVHRVLKPGGRFAFQEMAAGECGDVLFPAAVGHRSRRQLPGFRRRDELVARRERIHRRSLRGHQRRAFAQGRCRRRADATLTLAVFVENLAQKAANARRSLQEGQVRLVRSVCFGGQQVRLKRVRPDQQSGRLTASQSGHGLLA